ncbi:MAG: MATE family efflux transporter [Neisseriales bacterium]|nr:MAG: MATE family efflux transporter [Neisseriales bacterium]
MILSRVVHPAFTILHQTWPILLSQLAVCGFGIIDVMLVSHLCAQQSAAVGVGMNIFNTVSIGFLAILFILPPSISKSYAVDNHQDVASIVCQGVYLALLLTVPISVLLYFPDMLIGISQLNPATEAITRRYLFGLACATPAIMLFRVFYAYASGMLQTKWVMHMNLAGLMVKVPLAWYLVFGMGQWEGLGALGCSISSLCILWAQVIFAAWFIYRDQSPHGRFIFTHWSKPNWIKIGYLLKNGLPIGLCVFVDYTAHTMIGLCVARLGDVVTAGHQIASNIAFIIYLIPLALSMATTILVAHAIGKKDWLLARQTVLTAIQLAIGIALLVSTCLFFGNQLMVSLYTHHDAIHHSATQLIVVVAIYHFFDALVTVFLGILRAYNKTLVPALLLASTLWSFSLGGGYYLAFYYQEGMGAIGFWIAITVAEVLLTILIGCYAWRMSYQILRKNQKNVAPIL